MRRRKLRRSECVVLPLVLKRQWYDMIENGTKKIEWRRADYWLNRVHKWFRTAWINSLVPVVEFRHGYAKDARRMAFVCGWLWNRSKKRFTYCTPPYVWQNANIPVQHPELGETQIERVAILVGERVELVEQSSTIRTGTKAKKEAKR